MSDNATPHAAADYEAEVARTIPFHEEMVRQAIGAALAVVPAPSRWLDTGCGPGRLVQLAKGEAPGAVFSMADPSAPMLALARERNPEVADDHVFAAPSQELPDAPAFDVVTAVQCHHYGDAALRERAVRRCRELLAPGGVLVVFENVRAETVNGHDLQRRRWGAWMQAQGRDETFVAGHLAREGTRFFPLPVSEHLALLERVGFGTVELFWRSFGQAGLFAIRS